MCIYLIGSYRVNSFQLISDSFCYDISPTYYMIIILYDITPIGEGRTAINKTERRPSYSSPNGVGNVLPKETFGKLLPNNGEMAQKKEKNQPNLQEVLPDQTLRKKSPTPPDQSEVVVPSKSSHSNVNNQLKSILKPTSILKRSIDKDISPTIAIQVSDILNQHKITDILPSVDDISSDEDIGDEMGNRNDMDKMEDFPPKATIENLSDVSSTSGD